MTSRLTSAGDLHPDTAGPSPVVPKTELRISSHKNCPARPLRWLEAGAARNLSSQLEQSREQRARSEARRGSGCMPGLPRGCSTCPLGGALTAHPEVILGAPSPSSLKASAVQPRGAQCQSKTQTCLPVPPPPPGPDTRFSSDPHGNACNIFMTNSTLNVSPKRRNPVMLVLSL